MSDQREWTDADTGCYCRHWHDVNDSPCEETCRTCEHSCAAHNAEGCEVEGCDCREWVD